MQPRIYLIAASAVLLLAGCNAVAEKEQSAKDRSQGSYSSLDDLYLDDQDAFEGSGRGGGEVRDDLEASGSGLGPDDEDGDGGSEYPHNTIDTTSPKPVEPRITHTEDADIKVKETKETATRPEYIDVVETHGVNYHESDSDIREVHIMNPKHEDRASSFFAQPGVLAAVIGGAVVGLLCAILVVMFIVYRMRKKDEGSYALDEPRRSPATQTYPKPGAPHHNREFYA